MTDMGDNINENKILILETRTLSYSSTHIFLSEIAKQLKKMGFVVEHIYVSDIERESGTLEKFIGCKYYAVIDINSHLPLAKLGSVPYPDLIDANFINILVDHPMHLHHILSVELKRGVLVCLDKYHAEYAKRFYPSFKKIINIPLAGTYFNKKINFRERKHNVFFAGTYTPSDYFLGQMDSGTRQVAEDIIQFCGNYKKGMNHCSFPDIYTQIYGVDEELFAFQMYRMRAVERYMRELKREEVLNALLSGGIHLEVMGARWELFKTKYHKNLTIYNECQYPHMLGEMADSRVVLNIQPFFMEAPHDRISNAIVNGCVCLTDGCEWMDEYFEAGEDYIYYDLLSLNDNVDNLRECLSDINLLEEIAINSNNKGFSVANWENYCKKLFDN